MASLRDSLDASTRRRFRSGRACLDFVHTGGVGRWTAAELVHDGPSASRWLALVLDLDASALQVSDRDVAQLREFREAIWHIASSVVDGRPFPRQSVRQLNAAAADAPLRPSLGTDGSRQVVAPIGAAAAFSELARDAIDLFGGALRDRIRRCAADDCELLFVDTSRPGARRWCSMERCGSRAKMRRYRDA